MFSVRFSFLCSCFLWDAVKWQINRLLKTSEIYSLILLELKQSQMKTATAMAPNKRLRMYARFNFLDFYSLLYAKKKQKCNNQKFKVLRTQIFSHVISNSKRARTKFKLIGKFKMLRKFKHQRAFPARSRWFFLHIYSLFTQSNRKSSDEKFQDLRRNTNIRPSNIKFKTCAYNVLKIQR